MWRSLFESFGNFFSNKLLDALMGLAASILVLAISFPNDMSKINWESLLVLLIPSAIVLIVVPLILLFVGTVFTHLSQIIPINLKIEISPKPETIFIQDEKDVFKRIARNMSFLKITNNEHVELSNCYAIITIERTSLLQQYKSLLDIGEKKLYWRNSTTTPCETTIGAMGRSEVLYVYEIGKEINSNTNSIAINRNDFCFCDWKKSIMVISHKKVTHIFSIVIHGKLNGRDVKSTKNYFSIEIENYEASIHKKRFYGMINIFYRIQEYYSSMETLKKWRSFIFIGLGIIIVFGLLINWLSGVLFK